jgi:16S rRNA processing protein RimM
VPLRHPVATGESHVLPLGRLVAGHGVRGLARVKPFNPGSPALQEASEAFLSRTGSTERHRLRVRECRPHGGLFLLRFEGIDSLNDLEPWIGSLVEVDAASLPELAESEIYHHEAIGLAVRTSAGEHLGTVAEVMALPGNDVWVVHGEPADDGKPREWLIPVVAPIVTRIDLRERVAVVEPIPGLLDG